MKKRPKFNPKLTEQTLYLGWGWFIFELAFLPGLLLNWLGKLNFSDAWVNFSYYFLNFFVCLRIFRDLLKKDLKTAGKELPRFLGAVALGFAGFVLADRGVDRLLSLAAPGFSNVNDQHIAAMFARSPWPMAIGTVLLVPLGEECLFRGLIFGGLYRKNKAAAYALTAAGFAGVHVLGYWGQYSPTVLALCFVQYLIPGLLLCAVYVYSRTIFAPIFLHTAINTIAVWELM